MLPLLAPALTVPQGLVGYWPLDLGSLNWGGNIAYNRISGGINGTLNNFTSAALVAGKVGQALNFNGTNQYISGAGPSLNFNLLSICVWMKATSLATRQTLVSCSGAEGVRPMLEVGTASGGTAAVAVIKSGAFTVETGNNAVSTGVWRHVVLTKNGNGATHAIYVDGRPQTLITNTSETYDTATGGPFIGSRYGGSQFFAGPLDDVRIYNRALSAQEILSIYEAGRSGRA